MVGIKVLVVDRSSAFGEAVVLLLDDVGIQARHLSVSEVDDMNEATDLDVVLVDADGQRDQLDDVTEAAHRAAPNASLVLLCKELGHTERRLAAELGALGVVQRRSSENTIASALRRAAAGDPPGAKAVERRHTFAARPAALDHLTPREKDVLGAIAGGLTGADIAAQLSISPNTVRTHVQNVLGKLGVSSRLEAATIAFHAGLRSPAHAGRT